MEAFIGPQDGEIPFWEVSIISWEQMEFTCYLPFSSLDDPSQEVRGLGRIDTGLLLVDSKQVLSGSGS